jgi:hypothetical protein
MHGYFSNQERAASQARALPPFEKSFANETAEQRLRHREIAWRDRQRKRRRGPRSNPKTYIRIRELECIFADRYGAVLPNDDAGHDDIFVMANHLAHLDAPDRRIVTWLRRWAPWHGDDQTDELIEMVVPRPMKWRADALAQRIGLDYATRTRLGITTIGAIDCGKAKRAALRKKRAAARERARRAKAGAAPHATSEARVKPWKARGISRATYYRNRKNETDETNSCAACPKDIGVDAKQSHDDAQRARCARSVGPEFRVFQPRDTQRFTISIPVEFQSMMSRRAACIVAAVTPARPAAPRPAPNKMLQGFGCESVGASTGDDDCGTP